MNVIKWSKSLFSPKISSEYYVLEMAQNFRFKVVKKTLCANDPISVLRYKYDKKFGATTDFNKATKMCNKINQMDNE